MIGTIAGASFVGQMDAIRMLETWRVQTDTQALLFTGPEGIGKRTLAKQVALSLLCHDVDAHSGAACGRCSACRLFEAGTHPDFRHLAAEGKERNIPIDRIREQLVSDISMRPQQGKRKVYLIEADDLAETAQNAILKTLEEPYEYAFILLTVSQVSKLLPTTISRMQQIRLSSYSDQDMEKILERHGVNDKALIRAVLPASGGIPGTALILARSEWFPELRRDVFSLMSRLTNASKAEVITADVKYLLDKKEHSDMFLSLMEGWLRDLAVLLMTEDPAQLLHRDQLAHYQGMASQLKRKFSKRDEHAIITAGSQAVFDGIASVNDTRRALAQNANVEMTLTRLLLNLMKQLQ